MKKILFIVACCLSLHCKAMENENNTNEDDTTENKWKKQTFEQSKNLVILNIIFDQLDNYTPASSDEKEDIERVKKIEEALEFLLQWKDDFDINIHSTNNDTLLHKILSEYIDAFRRGREECAKIYQKFFVTIYDNFKNIDINIKDDNGNTPLMEMILKILNNPDGLQNTLPKIQVFLEKFVMTSQKIDFDCRNKRNQNVFQLADDDIYRKYVDLPFTMGKMLLAVYNKHKENSLKNKEQL